MKHRALSLGLACLSALAAPLASAPAQAQGLRLPSAAAPSLPPIRAEGSAPAGGAPRAADFIVAVVNSEPITNNEVRLRAERLVQQLGAQGASLPPRQTLAKEVLERLILEKVQVQQARDSGIKVDDWAVTQAEQTVARQNDITPEEMYRRLAADGISRERFREDLRNQLLALRVRERDVESRVRVSELDVDQYLREQQQAAGAGRLELNLGHILVKVPEDATPAQVAEREQRAQQAMAQLQAGGDFAALARQYSDALEGAQGGALGLRPAERYPELFVNATRNTAVGGIVGPVALAGGLSHPEGAGEGPQHRHAHHGRAKPRPPHPAAAQARPDRAPGRRAAGGAAQPRGQRPGGLRPAGARVLAGRQQQGRRRPGLGLAGRYVPEFEEALGALSPGEISPPVVSRFGVHLIQLLERREARLSQREQRDMVRDAVREKKLDEAFSNWLQEARARAYVEYREPPQL